MVIEPGDDLSIGPIGQRPVCKVGLPGPVRGGGFEAVPGGAGAVLGLIGDLMVAAQDPPERRDAGSGLFGESAPDGLGAGIEAPGRESVAEFQDVVDGGLAGGVRGGVGGSWVWGDGVESAGPVAGQEGADPAGE